MAKHSIIKTSITTELLVGCKSHVHIVLQVQVGQGGRHLPAVPGGRVSPTDPAVRVVRLDLLDLSAPDPLLSLSGKNTTPVLVIPIIILVSLRQSNCFIELNIPLLSVPLHQGIPVNQSHNK